MIFKISFFSNSDYAGLKPFIMKIILSAILLLNFLTPKAQLNVLKFNCADSIRYITNQGVLGDCKFYFQNEKPDIFYVENFEPQDFYNVVYKKDKSKLGRVKLLTPEYSAHIHDFIFATAQNDSLVFYYILKDSSEEQRLLHQD
jgi:hypothetical protein